MTSAKPSATRRPERQRDVSLARLTQALPFMLDPKVGVIADLYEHPRESDSPCFFRYSCKAADTRAFGVLRNFAIGGGAATTRDMGMAKTVGEALERYCAAIYDKNEFALASFENAPFDCVHPSSFALYDERQYRHNPFMFDPFLASSPVRWVPATDLHDSRQVHVPAAMVYVPYFYDEGGDETPITQPISTGLSCHCSFEEAAIGGLCEVVERDCFSITWQARLSRPLISTDDLSPVNQDLLERFTSVGYRVRLADISNESRIPAVLAVARNEAGFLPLVVGASAALTGDEAIRKALEELAHTERYAYQIKAELPPMQAHPEFDNIVGQVDHVSLWADPGMARHADFLTASPERRDWRDMDDVDAPDPRTGLECLVERLHRTGYQALVSDITTPDVRELGMVVVRALVPGYHPLFMGFHHRALGGERLWSLPARLGLSGIDRARGDNPLPHPFP